MSRLVSRAAALLVILVGAAGCSESATSVRGAPLHLTLAPAFSEQAGAIYRNLTTFAVTLDNVHVVVRAVAEDTPGPVLVDTAVSFPASASEVTIDVDLTLQADEQNVAATIELRQGTTAFFGGSQTFVARRGATTTAPEPVQLNYVGPGATAAFITIDPSSPTLAPSSSFQFAAHVFDQSEHTVTDLPLSWTTSDATIATVSQNGLVTSTGKSGSATLTVSGLNGTTQQTTVRVQPVASLAVQSGGDQSGIAGSTLPTAFQVQALDATQQAVIGAVITFAAASGAGSVSPETATTDAAGTASTSVTLGSAAGTYTFTAAIGTTVLARIVATATAAPVASLGIAGGNQQADTVLATLGQPLAVRVVDSFGNPVPKQTVDFHVTSGQAGLLATPGAAPVTETQVVTGTDGMASVALVGGAVAGTVRVTASIPNTALASVTFEESLRAATPTELVMLQQPSPTAQATIKLGRQPKVQVADSYGNAVALAGLTVVAFATIDCSSGALCGALVPGAGPAMPNATRLRRTVPNAARVPGRRLLRSAPRQSRLSVPVTIARTQSVSDTFPRGLGGTTQVVTDGNGVASFNDLSLDLQVIPGAWQIGFDDANESLAPAISSDIVLSPGPITSIVAQSGADTTYYSTVSDTLHPAVAVIDPVGNGIPGVQVTWSVVDGFSTLDSLTTTTDANGVASPGTWRLSSPTGGLLQFEIVATPNASKVENAPLHLFALPLLQ